VIIGEFVNFRQGKEKGRTFSDLRLHPNPAAATFDYFLANSQTDACARIFVACMQPLENHENAIMPFGIYSYTVVLD